MLHQRTTQFWTISM